MADWVGKATALLEPLADVIGRHVHGGQANFADDTSVAMLAPGTGKTQTVRLWTYGRAPADRGARESRAVAKSSPPHGALV